MAKKSFDDRRTERIQKSVDSQKRHKHISQSLKEFAKHGQNSDPETYEDMLDDMYDDLYDDE